jgi:hypothetical protein
MLNYEDSTFNIDNWYEGDKVGSWFGDAGVVLSVAPVSTSPSFSTSIEGLYCAQIEPNGTNKTIFYGTNRPINNGIPVNSSTQYTLAFYSWNDSDTDGGTLSIVWFDSFGVQVGVSSSSWVNGINSVTDTSPTTARYAGIKITLPNNENYYLDLVTFKEGSTVLMAGTTHLDYWEPRGAIVSLAPSKINYVLNPSFDSGTSNWTTGISNATIAAIASNLDSAPSGGNMLSVNITSSSGGSFKQTGNWLLPGKTMTLSFYARCSYNEQIITAKIAGVDGVTIDFEESDSFNLTSNWQRFTLSAYIPSDTDITEVDGLIQFIGSETINSNAFYIDCVQLEEGAVASDYFDSTRTDAGAIALASGYSALYPNLEDKLNTLFNELPDFLPLNTPFYITLKDFPYYGNYLNIS